MNTDLLGYVKAQLATRALPLTEVAAGSGVPYETLKKISSGNTPNPGVLHVQRLAAFFQARAVVSPIAEVPAPRAAAGQVEEI